MIRNFLPVLYVLTQEELGFSSDAKEAVAFALWPMRPSMAAPQRAQRHGGKRLMIFGKYHAGPLQGIAGKHQNAAGRGNYAKVPSPLPSFKNPDILTMPEKSGDAFSERDEIILFQNIFRRCAVLFAQGCVALCRLAQPSPAHCCSRGSFRKLPRPAHCPNRGRPGYGTSVALLTPRLRLRVLRRKSLAALDEIIFPIV
jgi:hypothetical protein